MERLESDAGAQTFQIIIHMVSAKQPPERYSIKKQRWLQKKSEVSLMERKQTNQGHFKLKVLTSHFILGIDKPFVNMSTLLTSSSGTHSVRGRAFFKSSLWFLKNGNLFFKALYLHYYCCLELAILLIQQKLVVWFNNGCTETCLEKQGKRTNKYKPLSY